MNIIIAILVLGVLIFVHEFGHFIVAKWLNVYVEKFSIGFGPTLLRKKYGETEYVISAFPLGGYVQMYGENRDGRGESENEEYDPAKEGRSFKDKSLWHRAAIVLAGPLFNVIFAIFIFWGLYMTGIPSFSPVIGNIEENSIAETTGLKVGDKIEYVNNKKIRSWNDFSNIIYDKPNENINIRLADGREISLKVGEKEVDNVFGDKEKVGYIGASLKVEAIIGDVVPSMPAGKAGFLKGDKIVAINGEEVASWSNSAEIIRSKPNEELEILVERNGEEILLKVIPKATEQGAGDNKKTIGLIGISPKDGDIIVRYGPIDAMALGLNKSYELSKLIYIYLGKFVTRDIPSDSLGGPIAIVETAAQSAESGFATLLIFIAAISLNLAIMNLLPIPVLDGGQLVIITAEGIMGRPLSEKALGAFQMFGLVVIISLMVLAFYNDIMRLIR